MATDREFLTSGGEAEFTEQPIKQVVSSALKENDGDLRRRSLPVRGIAQHHAVSDTPRSSSANGGCDTQQLTLHTETKAAFEDSSCGHGANKTSGDQVSNDESIATSPNIAGNVFRAIEYATCKKEDDSSADGATITTTSNDDGNHAQVAFSGQRQRHMAKERPHHAFRNQQKSLLFSGEPRTENTRNMELSSQQQPVAEIDFKHKDFEGNGTICNENSDEKSKEPDRETMIWHEQVENTNKTETRERSDTIESLVTFPRRQSETQRRPSCSSQLTSPPWSGEASRSRRVSVGGTSNFHTPDTTEKSDLPATRRGSRRRSSIAASALGSSNATQSRRDSVQGDGKKGSIGFGTLASSLVKWKINTLRAAKRAKETIAKDAKHQEFMDRTADRIKTEVLQASLFYIHVHTCFGRILSEVTPELPRSLLVSIQEEGYPIILRTVQAYRSQLGAKHKLTVQASDRLADLLRDLKSPY